MKKLALAVAFMAAGSTAFAAGFDTPVMEPEVIAAETQASTATGLIVPLILVALIAAAMSAQ